MGSWTRLCDVEFKTQGELRGDIRYDRLVRAARATREGR
jgi:hypothetical protein